MGKVIEVLNNVYKIVVEFLLDLNGKCVEFLKSVLPVNDQVAQYIVYGVLALIVLIIILIIVLASAGSKKRKAKKKLAKEAEVQKVEVKEEVQEVEQPVEEAEEEKVEEQPVQDEKVEETTEEKVVEDVPVVPAMDESEEVQEEAPRSLTPEEAENKIVEIVDSWVEEAKEEVQEEKPVKKTVNKANAKQPVEEVKPEVIEPVEDEVKTNRIAIGKYEVFPVNDVYLYRLKASNGEIMVTSEIYKSAKGAVSAIETVKKNVESGSLQIYKDKHDLWQFKLFASNKRLLVVSANYTTESSCENAANSFKKFAMISPVVILEEDQEHLMEEIRLEALADKKGGKLTINAIEDEFDFKLLASNGVILCSSSEYKTKSAINNAISSVKEAIKNGKFFVVKDKRGTFQFKLYSSLGRCVLVGEAYKTKSQAISAANSVSSFINLATIIDKTNEVVR